MSFRPAPASSAVAVAVAASPGVPRPRLRAAAARVAVDGGWREARDRRRPATRGGFELLGAPLIFTPTAHELRPERGAAQRRLRRRCARACATNRGGPGARSARPRRPPPDIAAVVRHRPGAGPALRLRDLRRRRRGAARCDAALYAGSAVTARPPGDHVHVRRDGRQPHRAARSDPAGLDRRRRPLRRHGEHAARGDRRHRRRRARLHRQHGRPARLPPVRLQRRRRPTAPGRGSPT